MSMAETLINDARTTASEKGSQADGQITQAMGKLEAFVDWNTGGEKYNVIEATLDLDEAPVFEGTEYEAPEQDFGPAPAMEPVPTSDFGNAPVAWLFRPPFQEVSTPPPMRVFDRTVPVPEGLTVPPPPDALANMNFVPPTLKEIVVPPAPSVNLPEFSVGEPDTDIPAPTDFEARCEANYANMSVSMRNNLSAEVDAYLNKINPNYSSQMARLEAKLAQFIEGGTALAPEVEQAIFNRARDKTNAEYLKTRDQIMKEGASKGFTIPGGAQYSALAQARQAASDNNARAAMEIAIKQAEMEQANVQFAVTQSSSLRGVVLQATASFFTTMVQLNGQALEYSRDMLQSAIALYEVTVKIVTARIEIYKAKAQVYEVRLKAATAIYEVYQAEIKGLEAQVNVDRAKVEAFSATASAYGALANTYKSLIDGVVAKAQVEKLKVDIFGEEVKVYSAEVGAKQAEWQGYTAQIQGETAKQQGYGEEVKAYTAEVEAYRANVNAWSEKVKGVSAQNEGSLKAYEASVRAWSALVEGEAIAKKAEIESFAQSIHAFIAKANAEEVKLKIDMAKDDLNVKNLQHAYELNIAAQSAKSIARNEFNMRTAEIAVKGADVYAHMASSAMSGMNGVASMVNIVDGEGV